MRYQHFRDFSPWSKVMCDLPRHTFAASNAYYARIFHFRHEKSRAKSQKNLARGYKQILRLSVFARVTRLRSIELLICTIQLTLVSFNIYTHSLLKINTYTALCSILSRETFFTVKSEAHLKCIDTSPPTRVLRRYGRIQFRTRN